MQNMTKVCTRYEMEIYGAALFRAIKDKGSKLMLLVIFFIATFIGYIFIFYRRHEEEEVESVRQSAAERSLDFESDERENIRSRLEDENAPVTRTRAPVAVTQTAGEKGNDSRGTVNVIRRWESSDAAPSLQNSAENKLTNFLRHRHLKVEGSDAVPEEDQTVPVENFKVLERPLKSVQEIVNRDSLSDTSDTTIRRKSSRWDSDDVEKAEREELKDAVRSGDEAEIIREVPRFRPTTAGGSRRGLHHNSSAEEFKSERKTWSDSDRAASVDDEWMEREKFFETLHSARSSVSASSLSLLVGSASQEHLSDHSLQSLSETDLAREGSVPLSETSRLQRTVQQLYAGRIEDRFDSLEEVSKAIEEAGLVHSRIIIGIDYTTSNMETGRKTFGGKCLHKIRHGEPNPYQEVIRILCKTLNTFDEDNMICAYGFGDSRTNDQHVFKLNPASLYCHGFEGVLDAYNLVTPTIKLGGPTTFAPIIEESVKIVQSSRMYTILIIIADGQLVDDRDTVRAIVDASNYPLSIVLVGVGDGPWDKMSEFDDALPQRKFDNFQFVNYHQVMKLSSMMPGQSPDSLFALMALMEIPDQYLQIKQLGYLDEATGRYRRSST